MIHIAQDVFLFLRRLVNRMLVVHLLPFATMEFVVVHAKMLVVPTVFVQLKIERLNVLAFLDLNKDLEDVSASQRTVQVMWNVKEVCAFETSAKLSAGIQMIVLMVNVVFQVCACYPALATCNVLLVKLVLEDFVLVAVDQAVRISSMGIIYTKCIKEI